MTAKCLSGVLTTDYPNFEVLLVDNRSSEQESFELFQTLRKKKCVRISESSHD